MHPLLSSLIESGITIPILVINDFNHRVSYTQSNSNNLTNSDTASYRAMLTVSLNVTTVRCRFVYQHGNINK